MCTISSVNSLLTSIPLSRISNKTKKCQSEARDRPDLIQTEPVPGGSLVHQNKMYFTDVTLVTQVMQTKLSCSPSSSNKTKKCQPKTGDRPDLIQTEPVPSVCHGQHTPRVTARSRSQFAGHSQHTPRVTAKTRSRLSGHTPHTPRVTVVVPVSVLGPSGHTLHTPRVTVVVPVRGHRLTRQQNKNQQNEKTKNTKTNYLSIPLSLVFCSEVSLPVANKLLCPVASLPVANKLAKVSVKHPDDKWITDVLTKIQKCQPAACILRESLHCQGHCPPVTASILRESLQKQGQGYLVIPHILRESLWWSLSVVTGHLVIPHTLRESLWWSLSEVTGTHTTLVTVKDQGSRLARQQNKNKQNEKYKNQKSNYLSNVTLEDSVKLTQLLSQSQVSQDTSARSYPGHTLHTPRVTVVVPVSGHMTSGHTPHTPRVTVVVPVSRSGHTLHTPRVTVVVPVSHHGPHTPRVTKDQDHRSRSWSRVQCILVCEVKRCNLPQTKQSNWQGKLYLAEKGI